MNLLTTSQAAERRGVSQKTIQAWIRRGLLKPVVVSRLHLIDPAKLDAVDPGKEGWPKGKARKKRRPRIQ